MTSVDKSALSFNEPLAGAYSNCKLYTSIVIHTPLNLLLDGSILSTFVPSTRFKPFTILLTLTLLSLLSSALSSALSFTLETIKASQTTLFWRCFFFSDLYEELAQEGEGEQTFVQIIGRIT